MRNGPKRLALNAALLFAASVASAQIEIVSGGKDAKAESPKVIATAEAPKNFFVKVDSKPIPFKVTYEVSRTVGAGRMVKQSAGKNGEIRTSYKVILGEDGKVVSKELIGTEKIAPVDAKILIGKSGYAASRGAYTRGKVMTMHASAYDPSAGRGSRATFRTATGERARYGVVAVDPRVIPLGTMVYVEGYGLARASDTGGAIKGNRIDLCMATYAECMRFGRRKVVVHILK